MRLILLVFSLGLFACDSPSREMRGGTTTEVQIGQSRYGVHVLGHRAQAIRLNFETGKKARGGMQRGFLAIEQASGCEIVKGSFDGDPAVMTAKLKCDAPG